MRIVALVVLAAVVLGPQVAVADSDGYYCVGRGYLAYETRSAGTPPKHELHVVRFDGVRGIAAAPPIALRDFQVHGMRCLPGAVELAGWDTTWTVDLSGPAPQIATSATGRQAPATPPANLGHWSRAQVVPLEADGADRFQLVIARVSQPVAGGVEHHTVSRVIQRRAKGLPGPEIVRSLQVFEGVFLETVD